MQACSPVTAVGLPSRSTAPKFAGKYWFDTEFRDTGDKVEFISIGIVDEKGRKFYAVSQDAKAKPTDRPWFKHHILGKLGPEGLPQHQLTREQIRAGILKFIGKDRTPEFWAYNNAYDVVALCQLFGGMGQLYSRFQRVSFFDIKQLANMLGMPALPPKPPDEHNALADAKWDKQAWKVLSRLAKERGVPIPNGQPAKPRRLV